MSTRLHRYSVVSASDNSVAYLPRDWKGDGTKTGVVFQCGLANGATNSAYDTAQGQPLMEALCARGFPVVMTDLGAGVSGGSPQWGNSNAITRYGNIRTYLQGTLGAKSGPIVAAGFSMGGLGSLNFAAANPSQVAAIAGFCAVTNLQTYRAAQTIGGASGLDLAYGGVYRGSGIGSTAGSPNITDAAAVSGDAGRIIYGNGGTPAAAAYSGSSPVYILPGTVTAGVGYTVSANAPFTVTGGATIGGYLEATYGATNNPATIAAAGGFGSIPVRLYTASNDTTAPTSAVPAVVASIGAAAAQVDMGALGHSYAVATAAASQFVTWLQSLGL